MTEGRASLMAYQERAETESLQRKLADTLKTRPSDPEGHRFMAMTEASLGHYGAAAHHYGEAIALGERTTEMLTLYGETLALDQGTPTSDVLAAFDEALGLDPQNIRARIERAECRFVLKDFAGAAEDLKIALDAARPGTELARMLQARLAKAEHEGRRASAPSSETGDAQTAMINGMVERLAARLRDSPQDLQGWTRLVHSYAVLGEKAKARDALARAREVFAADRGARAALDNAEQELR
jgi:cytochrome c-type biogenesis protein CcmH